MDDLPGRVSALPDVFQHFQDGPGETAGIVAAGGQVRADHIGGRGTVKSGDDDVFRNAEPLFPERIAHGDGHGIIGAEDCPGTLFAGADQLPDNVPGRLGPVVAIRQLLRPERQACFLQDFPVAPQTVLGILFVLDSGDEKGIPDAMVPDHVADDGLEAVLVVVEDGIAAGDIRTGDENGHIVPAGAVDDFIGQPLVMEGMVDNNDRVKKLVPDGPVPGAGGRVVLLVPIEIQRTVENADAVVIFRRGAAQFDQKTGIQKAVGLGKADGDHFLPVGHVGWSSLMFCSFFCFRCGSYQAEYSTEARKKQKDALLFPCFRAGSRVYCGGAFAR